MWTRTPVHLLKSTRLTRFWYPWYPSFSMLLCHDNNKFSYQDDYHRPRKSCLLYSQQTARPGSRRSKIDEHLTVGDDLRSIGKSSSPSRNSLRGCFDSSWPAQVGIRPRWSSKRGTERPRNLLFHLDRNDRIFGALGRPWAPLKFWVLPRSTLCESA
jgi:hypothetical protein